MITSITLNGLEIGASSRYVVAEAMLAALVSAPAREPVMFERPGRYPKFVRSQVQARPFTIGIFLIEKYIVDRQLAFYDLVTAAGDGTLVSLVIRRTAPVLQDLEWLIHCSGPVADGHFYQRAVIEAVAPDPVAVVTNI